jgi:pimeloyl-ACP methyl ester carboxylesterase
MAKIPLLLLPGLNATFRLWQPQIKALSDMADIWVPDTTRHDAIANLAASILAEAPPRFALGGLSMGGYVAFEIMRRAPERVMRLALVDTQARPGDAASTQQRLRLIDLALRGGVDKVLAASPWTALVAPSRADDRALGAIIEGMARDIGAQAYARQQRLIMNRPDSRPTLAAITVASLVIVGEQDPVTPPDLSREMASGIAGARIEIIPDCGHLSSLECPEAVSRALRQWLLG